MQIQIAQLVPHTEEATEDGITGANYCVVRLPDTSLARAVLKQGEVDEIFAEAFCALVLRSWNLPVPTPYLVPVADSFGFASVDVGYPNLKQKIGFDKSLPPEIQSVLAKRIVGLLFSLQSTHLAIACDEAIGNRDRNFGNVVTDGSSEYWIDHACCLTRAAKYPDSNLLCVMATGSQFEESARAGGVANSVLLSSETLNAAGKALTSHGFSSDLDIEYVRDRMQSLANRILQRFPTTADLLAEN